MLIMEASFLLRTSSLSIQQIADRLHFADAPSSFSKFFLGRKESPPVSIASEDNQVGKKSTEKAERELEIYRDREMRLLESDFDKAVKALLEKNKDCEE